MLPYQASAFSRIDVEAPNRFTVVFPSSKGAQRQYCEDEKSKITAKLSRILGCEVAFRCLIDARTSETPPTSSRPSNSNAYARPNYPNRSYENRPNGISRAPIGRQIPNLAEIEKNETVRQIKETFDATLFEVKSPPVVKAPNAESAEK